MDIPHTTRGRLGTANPERTGAHQHSTRVASLEGESKPNAPRVEKGDSSEGTPKP
ncbi:hypothetical protein [Halobiforma nitratireducens]|uniref:hypothetical protein n=1 Tax=Halobiforma nitratireducens TaxID=130048 RepID=UPI00135F1147|nr:hypothetical protein [Halobiforma nitratireducens]